MAQTIIFSLIALLIGVILSWLWSQSNFNRQLLHAKEEAQNQYNNLEKEFVGYKSSAETLLTAASQTEQKLKDNLKAISDLLEQKNTDYTSLNGELATANAIYQAALGTVNTKDKEIEQLKKDIAAVRLEWETNSRLLATEVADNKAIQEKLDTQKSEMEKLNQKFSTKFENIANNILDAKTQKFTDLNKDNLKSILDPLGDNINEFKKQVDKVYNDEAKERFSLGNEVKRLAELNQLLGEEAKNLTKALKGEAKTQGRWGEVILETILEKSGLRKGEEYFVEYQLFDAEGNPLRSEAEGKKMRPDALVMYPDNRHIIIDSKVSLNAYVRYIESDDNAQQYIELAAHVTAVKNHINELSKKAYDDYNKTLDFVMMFIPSEPAYIAAMQGDPEIWNYAYDKRILLISPTNLIASLKLMVDLWKREYQNQNAQAIAERGAKMYDKFVGFIENLDDVGLHLGKAQGKFNEAYKQLSTGNDNLVGQATKLKALGLKNKKEISASLSEFALQSEIQALLPEDNNSENV